MELLLHMLFVAPFTESMASLAHVATTVYNGPLEIQDPSKVQKLLPGAGYQALAECETKISPVDMETGRIILRKKLLLH